VAILPGGKLNCQNGLVEFHALMPLNGHAGGSQPQLKRSGIIDHRARTMVSLGMVIKSIREFNRTVPFVPYEIHMASGERYSVPHPDFISISPAGSYVVIIDAHERPHHLNALVIERASLVGRRRRHKARKGSA